MDDVNGIANEVVEAVEKGMKTDSVGYALSHNPAQKEKMLEIVKEVLAKHLGQ